MFINTIDFLIEVIRVGVLVGFLILRGKTFSFLSLSMMLAAIDSPYQVEEVPFHSSLLRSVLEVEVGFYQIIFVYLLKLSYGFSFLVC